MVIEWVSEQLDEAILDATDVLGDVEDGLDWLLDIRSAVRIRDLEGARDELLAGGARLRTLARAVADDAAQVRDELDAVCDAADEPWDEDDEEIHLLAERAGTAGLAAGVLVERSYQLLAARRMWRDGVTLLSLRCPDLLPD